MTEKKKTYTSQRKLPTLIEGFRKPKKFNFKMQFKKLPHTFGIILHLNTQKSKYSHV